MSATPIPRTLGLTLYADLDLSVIGSPPPGRRPVKTVVRNYSALRKLWEFVRLRISEGRQAFIVYPRVEEAEAETQALLQEESRIRQELEPATVGVLHGRMSSPEREKVMESFRRGELQVLMATSLIEVGVDVPNATVMVVQSADQFGLAQLHQLRGRVGRGSHESYCILVSGNATEQARERLRILEGSEDGFAIAEADLRLRGPGEFLGKEQSGFPKLRFGNPAEDFQIIRFARDLVAARWRELGSRQVTPKIDDGAM